MGYIYFCNMQILKIMSSPTTHPKAHPFASQPQPMALFLLRRFLLARPLLP